MEEKELDNKPILRLAFPEETDNKLSPPNDEEILIKIGNIKFEQLMDQMMWEQCMKLLHADINILKTIQI